MTIKKVTTEEELEQYVTGGTLHTGKTALKQGKPVFIGIPDGEFDDVQQIIESMKERKEEQTVLFKNK